MDDPLASCTTGFGPLSDFLVLIAQDGGASGPGLLGGVTMADVGTIAGELLLAALFVIVLSALCSMTEAAFLSLSQLKAQGLTESSNRLERRVGRLRLSFDKPLATIVILNNIANVAGMAVTGKLAGNSFEKNLPGYETQGMLVFTGAMTLLVIIFGEIVPKTFGETHHLRVAKVAAYPILWLQKVLSPVIWLIGFTQRPFSRTSSGHVTSEEEIARLTSLGQEQGAIGEHEGELIQRVFKLNDSTAEDIMTPRVEMVMFEADQTLGEIADELAMTPRTRIPLFRDTRDHIVAILDRVDALLALAKDMHDLPATEKTVSFKPLFVPESMPANRLLVRLQRRTEPVAIVVGEYGETVGLVTLEDVLEELVGEIVDEEDIDVGTGVHRTGDDEVMALGRAEVKDVNQLLGSHIPNHRSVAGLLLDALGRIPEKGDTLDAHGVTFIVNEANDRAILRVCIRVDAEAVAAAAQAQAELDSE